MCPFQNERKYLVSPLHRGKAGFFTFHKITKVEFYKYSQKKGEMQVEIVSSDSGWNEIIFKIICIETIIKTCKFCKF